MHIGHFTNGEAKESGADGLGRDDVTGTLWTLRHSAGRARCELTWRPDGWQLQFLIDDDPLQGESWHNPEDILTVAELWRERLLAMGWRRTTPLIEVKPKPDRRRTPRAE
jgi:hypothetical protein